MNAKEFVQTYIETGDDGHDFMPEEIKEDLPTDQDKKEWITEQLLNVISENDSRVTDEDAEVFLHNKDEIIDLALEYVNDE
jgi:hypothetical protein